MVCMLDAIDWHWHKNLIVAVILPDAPSGNDQSTGLSLDFEALISPLRA